MTDPAPTALPLQAEVLMLTQDACPDCERLKLMLDKPLRGQFASLIHPVHRQNQPDEFESVVALYNVQKTPALINTASGRVLLNTGGLGEVKAFLLAASQTAESVGS
ncbi:hypothetical protein [Deinococcus sp. Leaf326]|uniref:hypothetical protein n=1 Tax=Deinococcus sp. Leaf326 TaxID=1736338 RepID=UPI0006F9184F|nr:hypothetical protein [Deinococcus sp. Leaf326]KQR22961.1 thioredoxin [Deinococcus sp. Leaf326]